MLVASAVRDAIPLNGCNCRAFPLQRTKWHVDCVQRSAT
ncbi:hypothetical protein PLANPX_3519 [Lacipirellula parvula]|uniref:Uncharacterized protein n=1 Tax=Lacipirellula parvula TaxID=2650471 RepID=A0A5K7XD26_9BACT|nr:hypothetical protein PLANPX_3519 [Lacipirellula parvula]